MQVIERSEMPNGTHIQIEDWSEDYPSLNTKNDIIGLYPTAKHDGKNNCIGNPYPKRGERFRLGMQFKNETETRKTFEKLQSGEKTYWDYLDNISPTSGVSRDNFVYTMEN